MFDRTANLANNQIINYRCDPTEKWLVLIGIAPGSSDVCISFPVATLRPCTWSYWQRAIPLVLFLCLLGKTR